MSLVDRENIEREQSGATIAAPTPVTPIEKPPRLVDHYYTGMGLVIRTERGSVCVAVETQDEMLRFNEHLAALIHPGLNCPHQGNC